MEKKEISKLAFCEICYSNYDCDRHLPLIICSMHHTVCRECLYSLGREVICPYCRQKLQLTNIVVNYYIYDLLKPETDHRSTTDEQQIDVEELAKNPANSSPKHRQQKIEVKIKTDSINYRPPWFVYNQQEAREIQATQDNTRERLAWHKIYTLCIVVAQIPLISINLYIAIIFPFDYCMDVVYQVIPIDLRSLFLVIGLIELILLTAMVLINRLNNIEIISLNDMLKYGVWIVEFAVAKILLSGLIEVNLFISGMISKCSEGIVGYAFVLMVIHFTVGLIYICHKLH